MAQIIQLDFNKTNSASGVIDIATVQQSCRKLKAGLIAPATEEVHTDLAVEHAAEPIKSMDDIILHLPVPHWAEAFQRQYAVHRWH